MKQSKSDVVLGKGTRYTVPCATHEQAISHNHPDISHSIFVAHTFSTL